MSTANKLTYLNTTKQKIKEGLNNLGADLTENDTFRSYANVLSDMYDELPKVTESGTDLELSNTKKGKLVVTPKGNSSQFSTTGKNFLNVVGEAESNGITSVGTIDGKLVSTGTLTDYWFNATGVISCNIPAGTYTFSIPKTTDFDVRLILYSTPPTEMGRFSIAAGSKSVQVTTSQQATAYRLFYVKQNSTGTAVNITLYPMLELGSTDTTYEPYTGGIPAPNPDYPYPVKTVTGENSLKIINKNLLDWTQCTQNKAWNESGQLVNNSACWACNEHQPVKSSSITFSIDFTQSSGTQGRVYQFNSSGTLIVNTAITTFPTTITFNQNTAYYVYYFVNSMVPFESKLQIEKGSTATEYVEHRAQFPYSISLGDIELCEVGDYQDYIYGSPNHWYKKQVISKHNLTDFSWSLFNNNHTNNIGFRGANIGGVLKDDTLYCYNLKKYGVQTLWTTDSLNGIGYSVTGDYFVIYILRSYLSAQTQTAFNTWLQNNPSYVYGILATPQDIPITDETLISQLNNIHNNAYSYNGTTNITSTYADGNAQMIIDASALKSWEVTE